MKIAIVGTGALGGYYGAKLARASNAVRFLARGATLQALRTHGLHIERDYETWTLSPVEATDDPARISAGFGGPAALALVTTKAYGLEGAVAALKVLAGPETAVLPLLNGADIAERLRALGSPGRILGGLTYIPCAVPAPGTVRQAGPEKELRLGPLDSADSALADRVLNALQGAGILAARSPDIRVDLWTKFVLICATTGVQAVTRVGFGASRADPEAHALYPAIMREVEAVARAAGIAVPADVVARQMAIVDSYVAGARASMLQDLEAGKPLELETLQGTLVRLGRSLGIPTPVNAMVYATLKLHAKGKVSRPN